MELHWVQWKHHSYFNYHPILYVFLMLIFINLSVLSTGAKLAPSKVCFILSQFYHIRKRAQFSFYILRKNNKNQKFCYVEQINVPVSTFDLGFCMWRCFDWIEVLIAIWDVPDKIDITHKLQ